MEVADVEMGHWVEEENIKRTLEKKGRSREVHNGVSLKYWKKL